MSYDIEKDWTTSAGLRAVVIMGDMGHRCGYVGVPTDHPLHGVAYSEKSPYLKLNPERSTEKMSPIQVLCGAGKDMDDLNSPEYVFEVHGGLTFSGDGKGKYPVEADLWWFGYDCGHAGDAPAPGSCMAQYSSSLFDGDVHRTLEYCIDECESLASQLAMCVAEKEIQDDYSIEAETLELLHIDTRTDSERILDRMMDERGANEQGAEPHLVLRQIALDLLDERS